MIKGSYIEIKSRKMPLRARIEMKGFMMPRRLELILEGRGSPPKKREVRRNALLAKETTGTKERKL